MQNHLNIAWKLFVEKEKTKQWANCVFGHVGPVRSLGSRPIRGRARASPAAISNINSGPARAAFFFVSLLSAQPLGAGWKVLIWLEERWIAYLKILQTH